MISRNRERAPLATTAETSRRRFGPWPWYLSAADLVGLDVDVVDDIAGDLIEECAAVSGPRSLLQRAWCAGQVLRSLPHLALGTLRRGQRRARLRLLAAMCTLLAAATSLLVAIQLHVGPPASIAADRGFDANGIVINNFRAVQMPIRALDARGRTVSKAPIHYELFGGDAMTISPSGAASCVRRGEAVVRASVDDVTSLVTVHCRPVSSIYATPTRFDFVQGDAPQSLQVQALDERAVTIGPLRGSVGIANPDVAALDHGLVAPRGVGSTRLTVAIGDARVNLSVVVHEIVTRFDKLTAKQRNVAMPLRLAPGDTLHLPAPAGTIWVKWLPRDGTSSHPALTAEGSGYCHMDSEAFVRWLPQREYGAYCYLSDGAGIRVARSTGGPPLMSGALLLEVRSR